MLLRAARTLGLLCVLMQVARAPASPPRVFLLDGKQLESARDRVRQNDPALVPAIEKLKRDADAAMALGPFSVIDKQIAPPSGDKHDYMSQAPYFWPDPDKPDGKPYIRKDGQRNPEIKKIPDRTSMRTLSDTVQVLGLAYYFTGEAKYADRAALLLRTWFIDPKTRMSPNLQFAQGIPGINTGRGIGIIETGSFTSLIDGVGLLAGSAAWTDADDRALREWFTQYVKWMRESQNGRDEAAAKNNHGTVYDVQVSLFALFVGDDATAREVLKAVPEKRIAVQIEPDGRQPLELERTKGWSYSIMNIRAHMQLAQLGEHVGVDLWNAKTADERSLRKALDFLVPFATAEQNWPYEQINGFRPLGAEILIRRAAQEFPNETYRKLAAKLPLLPPEALDHLTGARLIANDLDSQ